MALITALIIEMYLADEFMPLIGKRVQCSGNFRKTNLFDDDIILDAKTVLDCERPAHQLKTVFYEPEEVELPGKLYEVINPGPPEYLSIELGDLPEKTVILTLKEPINIGIKEEDNFNESEMGVRELQVVFSDSMPLAHQMKEEVTLIGTLFHAHTAHHQRRVLIIVKSWSAK